MSRRLFTSESVTEGHPDKIADAISDSILDGAAARRPHQPGRRRDDDHDRPGAHRRRGHDQDVRRHPDDRAQKILEIGYDSSKKGFDGESCGVSVSIGAQSPDIAQGVDTAYEQRVEGETDELDSQGAGDQGLMSGSRATRRPS